MNLHDHYQAALKQNGFQADTAQERAIETLNRVATELGHAARPSVWRQLLTRLHGDRTAQPVTGAYLWGGVGRGKTFMMDLFFESLPFERKQRFHFHRLMNRVHDQLKELRQHQDPLSVVADEFADQARVICFDEFFVSDIADAMILAKLLDALFQRGVTLVATSNIHPSELYKGGLQRRRFEPAIELISRYTDVISVDGPIDYRLRVLEQAEIYHAPLDEAAEINLERYFSSIAPDPGDRGQPMDVLGRQIETRRMSDGVAWFDFQALCDGPRSQEDYIEIARCYQTVLLSNTPQLDEFSENAARRFIALIDEFYDRRVKLIMSAAVPVGELYVGRRLGREFERTASRLREMQSTEYLACAHRP